MKFLHVSDLHIGKIVNDFSMLEDQQFILEQIKGMAVENHVDAVVIAGDIYDRAIPSGEAVVLFDAFLTALSRAEITVIMISGNHDSPERISFGKELLNNQKVYIAGVWNGNITKVDIEEKGIRTEFVLLPFMKPAQVGASNSGEAVKAVLSKYWENETTAEAQKRVLVTHYFVTDGGKEPELSDSETTIHVGGLDNVEASIFDGFDYVALGHIHKLQRIGNRPVWYCGSPLKYSFGEVKQAKVALLVDLDVKGEVQVKELSLRPMRELRKIKGTLAELLKAGQNAGEERMDYLQAILTDEGELIDPIGTLRSVYPNVMQIVRDDDSNRLGNEEFAVNESQRMIQNRGPLALFEDFYQEVKEEEISIEGKEIMTHIIKDLEG